ncbi:Myb family DNA-binding domain-containing protein [Toxoplasma gondii ARI]|uniref:Myb family DNA-binding domain-containing protein n=1 Tax=Toxoplasma gondii ARI TaxID=1074872 RepID=A0A139XQY2_TOXGO|nr:Myb family DNA-binding domain-containing protein [Toxoplasma gondii ARI]
MAEPSSEDASASPESHLPSSSELHVGLEQNDVSHLPADPPAESEARPSADVPSAAVGGAPPLSTSSSFESSASSLPGAFLSRSVSSDLYDASFTVEEEDDDLLRKMHFALQDDEDSASTENAATCVSSSMGLLMDPSLGGPSSLSGASSSVSTEFFTASFASSSSSVAVSGLAPSAPSSSPPLSSQRQSPRDGNAFPLDGSEEGASPSDSGTQAGSSPAAPAPNSSGGTTPLGGGLRAGRSIGSAFAEDSSVSTAAPGGGPRLDRLGFAGSGDPLFPSLPAASSPPTQKDAERTENIVGMGLAALHKALAKKAQEAAAKAREEGSETGVSALPTRNEDFKIAPLSACFLKTEDNQPNVNEAHSESVNSATDTKAKVPADAAEEPETSAKGDARREREETMTAEAHTENEKFVTEETRERAGKEGREGIPADTLKEEQTTATSASSPPVDSVKEERTEAESHDPTSLEISKALRQGKSDSGDDGDLSLSKDVSLSVAPSFGLSASLETGDSDREAPVSPSASAPQSPPPLPSSPSVSPSSTPEKQEEMSASGECSLVTDPQLFRLLRALEQAGGEVEEKMMAEEKHFADTAAMLLRELDMEAEAAVGLSAGVFSGERSGEGGPPHSREDGEEDSEEEEVGKKVEGEEDREEEIENWEDKEKGHPPREKTAGSLDMRDLGKSAHLFPSFCGTSLSSFLPLRANRHRKQKSKHCLSRTPAYASLLRRKRLERKIKSVRETLLAAVGAAEEDIGILEKEFQNVAECEISPFPSANEIGLPPYCFAPAFEGLPSVGGSRGLFALPPGVCRPDRGDSAWLPPSAWPAAFNNLPLTSVVSESIVSSLPSSPLASTSGGGLLGADEDQGDAAAGDTGPQSHRLAPSAASRSRVASRLSLLLPSITSDSSARCPTDFGFEACPNTPDGASASGFLRPASSAFPRGGGDQRNAPGLVSETLQEATRTVTGDGSEAGGGCHGALAQDPSGEGTDTNDEECDDIRLSVGDEGSSCSLSSASLAVPGEGVSDSRKPKRSRSLEVLPGASRPEAPGDSSPSLAPGETDSEETLCLLPGSALEAQDSGEDLRGALAQPHSPSAESRSEEALTVAALLGGYPSGGPAGSGAPHGFAAVSAAFNSCGNDSLLSGGFEAQGEAASERGDGFLLSACSSAGRSGALAKGKGLATGPRAAGGGKKRGGRAATARAGADWVEADRTAKQQRLPLELFSLATKHTHEEAYIRAAASFWEKTKNWEASNAGGDRCSPERPSGENTSHDGSVNMGSSLSCSGAFYAPVPPALPALFLAAQQLQPAVGSDGIRRGPWLSHGEDISAGIRVTNRRRALVSLLEFLREVAQVAIVQVREPLSRLGDGPSLASTVAAATAVAASVGGVSPRVAGGAEKSPGVSGGDDEGGQDSRELGEDGKTDSVCEEDRRGSRGAVSHADGVWGSKASRADPASQLVSSSGERREAFISCFPSPFAASSLSPFAALPQSPAVWFDPPVPATVWGGEVTSGASAGWLGSNSALGASALSEREGTLGKGEGRAGPVGQKAGPVGPAAGGSALAEEDEGGRSDEERRWASLPGFGGGSVERVVLYVRRDGVPAEWLREMPFECKLQLEVEAEEEGEGGEPRIRHGGEADVEKERREQRKDSSHGESEQGDRPETTENKTEGTERTGAKAPSPLCLLGSDAGSGVSSEGKEGKDDTSSDREGRLAPREAQEKQLLPSLQDPRFFSSASLVRCKPPFLRPPVSSPPFPPQCRIPKCTCCVEVSEGKSASQRASSAAAPTGPLTSSPSLSCSDGAPSRPSKRKRPDEERGADARTGDQEKRRKKSEEEENEEEEEGGRGNRREKDAYFVMDDALAFLSRVRRGQREALLQFQKQASELCMQCFPDEATPRSCRREDSLSVRERSPPLKKLSDEPSGTASSSSSSSSSSTSSSCASSLRRWWGSLRALGLPVSDVVQAISIAEREERWAKTPSRHLRLSVDSLVRDRGKEEFVELAFFLPHKPSTVEPWQVALELSEEDFAADRLASEVDGSAHPRRFSQAEGEKAEGAGAAPATPRAPFFLATETAREAEVETERDVESGGRGSSRERTEEEREKGEAAFEGDSRSEGPSGKGIRGRAGRGGRGGKNKTTGKRKEREEERDDREEKAKNKTGASESKTGGSDRSPSTVSGEGRGGRGTETPREFSLLAVVENFEKNCSKQDGDAVPGPAGIRRVWQVLAQRKAKMQSLFRQQKRLCRALFKSWRRTRLAAERLRISEGDAFAWGVLPVRALDHPEQLVSLPAGFRTGSRWAPYQSGCELAEAATEEEKRTAGEGSRRSARGQECATSVTTSGSGSGAAGGTDRQRAKEEAASRESKREWMQANYANLTGPGVFWRDSCLFSLGQSARQRLDRRSEQGPGVYPLDLIEKDLDFAILDIERAVSFHDRSSLLKDVAQVELEKKTATVWAEAEARTFVEKFLMYPKNFEKIASYLDGKNTKDCVVSALNLEK